MAGHRFDRGRTHHANGFVRPKFNNKSCVIAEFRYDMFYISDGAKGYRAEEWPVYSRSE
jgi:hypothetical protein